MMHCILSPPAKERPLCRKMTLITDNKNTLSHYGASKDKHIK